MKILVIFLSFILLYSCQELGSNGTLTCSKKSTIDTSIIGIWQFIESKEYNQFKLETKPHSLIVFPFNKNEYILMFISDSNNSETPTLFKAIESRVSGKRIANIQPIFNKPTNDFIYYPFEILSDTLYFWGFYTTKVPQTINKKNTIKKFILKHFNDTNYLSSVRKYIHIKTNRP